ncbi:MAG: hypothetical protein P8183_04210 [Anaerolineae bacterium]
MAYSFLVIPPMPQQPQTHTLESGETTMLAVKATILEADCAILGKQDSETQQAAWEK